MRKELVMTKIKWYGINVKLPNENNTVVIVYNSKWNGTCVAKYYNDNFYDLSEDGDKMTVEQWAELPLPPT